MKKVIDLVKPYILIILGALLFLYFMNWLSNEGAGLALGIIAIVLAVYYLAVGVLSIVVGNKFSPMIKTIIDVVAVAFFAVFMFVLFLLSTIEGAKIDNYMGPAAWVIAIVSMLGALALAGFYVLYRFMNQPLVARFTFLFSAVFALVLVLNILFNGRGNPIALGDIDIILVAIYGAYLFYLFNALQEPAEEAQPEPVQPAQEVKQEEPAPAEEEHPAE